MGRTATVAAGVLCALYGCGTAHNLAHHGAPYGGARADTHQAAGLLASSCLAEGSDPMLETAAATYLLAVDLPLSAVGDTLTLPLTAGWEVERVRKQMFAERFEHQPAPWCNAPPAPAAVLPPPDAPAPGR
jgi:uncharacterized protein YceK